MPVIVTGAPQKRPHWSNAYPKEQIPSGNEKFLCGQLLAHTSNVLSGHGTYLSENGLLASVCGNKVQYSCLIQIEPLRQKYYPKVGDVVVGRIVRIRKARWKVDINHSIGAILFLSNVNLPGGELRRKNVEDEIFMIEHLTKGDLVSAEVQQIRGKGHALLHTRNLRYGKLGQGIIVKVWSSLVKQQKQYMHEFFGFGVIFGCNGIIWISSILFDETNGGYTEDLSCVVPRERRLEMIRLAACVRMLAANLICIYDITVQSAYLASLDYKVHIMLVLFSLEPCLITQRSRYNRRSVTVQIKDLAHPQVVASLIPPIIEMTIAEEKRRMDARDREERSLLRRYSK
ncbi:exosome non-catalytic core subunit rrp4 [Parelaphostrongylus tenuis]|uniref:Exosome non-catalytic core subunit rrp4 n=1 Tax=Parelaphostrongylus tenuis TaxID=148309 RepID=A0AAD5MTB6_PARTN|nr:exosome non-catalytic core subunit rrp4 [Parelaphostrongylus tenuis]